MRRLQAAGGSISIPAILRPVKLFSPRLKTPANASICVPGSTARRLCFIMTAHFMACTYTYPDYLWAETLSFFTELRIGYLAQLRRQVDSKTANC